MSSRRRHIELASIDMASGWEPRDLPAGFEMRVLADDLDETAKTGARTRLVRLAPGAAASGSIVHDFWEETYLVAGDMVDLTNKRTVQAPIYSLRPPGTPHGPFGSETGCTVLEIQYYVK
jgi:ChrR Cupin-like domain